VRGKRRGEEGDSEGGAAETGTGEVEEALPALKERREVVVLGWEGGR
jgi:hypothetical protein